MTSLSRYGRNVAPRAGMPLHCPRRPTHQPGARLTRLRPALWSCCAYHPSGDASCGPIGCRGAVDLGILSAARHWALKARGTLWFGIAAGILFAVEFILIFQGLLYTTASRATLFIYLAPFFVVLGARIVLPADRFKPAQWLGLSLSFIGMVIAFGVPTPATDPRQLIGDVMMVGAALFWAATTLTIKASPLARASAEKVMLYQLVISAPVMAIAAILLGERIAHVPSAVAIGSMAYQTVWVVSVTFVIWFALIARYSASRLSAFTFLTPLFGVAAGHLVLGDPLTPAFAAAVALVAAGLVLVNRA
jgi:drug/metabolite transporter (DMT)-like permease